MKTLQYGEIVIYDGRRHVVTMSNACRAFIEPIDTQSRSFKNPEGEDVTFAYVPRAPKSISPQSPLERIAPSDLTDDEANRKEKVMSKRRKTVEAVKEMATETDVTPNHDGEFDPPSMEAEGHAAELASQSTQDHGPDEGREETMSKSKKSAKSKTTKSVKTFKAAKATRAPKADEGELKTFAVRIPIHESEAFHKFAGPAGASRFCRELMQAAVAGSVSDFKRILDDASLNASKKK